MGFRKEFVLCAEERLTHVVKIYELLGNVPRIFYSTSRIEIVNFSNPDVIRIRLKVTKRCCFRWFLRSPFQLQGDTPSRFVSQLTSGHPCTPCDPNF